MQTSSNTSPEAIDLAERLSRFEEHRSPELVARFDGHDPMPIEPTGTPDTADPATAGDEDDALIRGTSRRTARGRGRQRGGVR